MICYPTHQTLHPQIFTHAGHYKIPLMVKILTLVEIKYHVEKFFVEKSERFWKSGIFKLHDTWRKVVEQNDNYMIQ